jgi:hypothetical protein
MNYHCCFITLFSSIYYFIRTNLYSKETNTLLEYKLERSLHLRIKPIHLLMQIGKYSYKNSGISEETIRLRDQTENQSVRGYRP